MLEQEAASVVVLGTVASQCAITLLATLDWNRILVGLDGRVGLGHDVITGVRVDLTT